MRKPVMMMTACAAITLSGCSQISSWLKGSDAATPTAEAELRSTPTESYSFGDTAYEVELYDTANLDSTPNYAGYEVVLYDAMPGVKMDPREAGFVSLNGESRPMDWRNCETRSRGYLYVSEYDFRLDPEFEVCMRNKGYVLTTEAGRFATQSPLTAQTAGLRGFSNPVNTFSTYSTP